jgi:glycosyltransferase involved in cell wall biosynthesis
VLDEITPIVLTFNEAPNIGRTLRLLEWARAVVVFDSHSTDETPAIAAGFRNVRFRRRPFDTLAGQWNAALLDPEIEAEWVLALDADYVVSPALVAELAALSPPPSVAGYRAHFEYAIAGAPLRGSLYPPHVVLFRRARGHYVQDGHAYRLVLDGEVADLREKIVHDDRKPLAHWLASQRKYARQEAERLRSLPWSGACTRDRVRKALVVAPWLVPLYALLAKGGLRDGRRGLRYAAERAIAETFIARALLRAYLGAEPPA